ncbi:uncharacterized protein LOC123683382 [Harmonia axyridis]|uniref:uncharacterized protein LOC123683382 n=1 Tax=Harmonia axyridis TaxID=115357 RepID=UPI001E276CAE|nr:uncharacterized protein LOC123683382 [Harmonia axyridis]
MHLQDLFWYLLPLVPVKLVQTPPYVYKNISIFMSIPTAAFECLETVIKETFRYTDRSLISLTVTGNQGEIEDLQNKVIRYLNKEGNATLKLLGEPPHPEFQSSTICFKESNLTNSETCRKNFVPKESTNFFVIIAGNLETLDSSLHSVFNSTTFNPFAEFLLYWSHPVGLSLTELFSLLWKYHMLKVIVIEHDLESDNLGVHVLQLKLLGPGLCLKKSRFVSTGSCKNSGHQTRLRALMRSRIPRTFKNCTIEAIAMKYEPFVINEDKGIEIKLLKEMGRHNNITFSINVTKDAKDWGDKVNGTWNGNFAEIINTLKVGIGNVGPEADRLEDFDFTYSYKSPILVWVVPIAGNVKKWRVLTIIFAPLLWSIIFAVFILLAGLIVTFSRYFGDNPYLQSISGGFLTSLQLLISSSVYKTPTITVVRLVFLGGLLFGLILTCVYSSYLINVLTKAVKEHQIHNEQEIVESNLVIGGLEEYLERFQKSDNDDCLDDICRRYQYSSDENDTAMFWLKKVEDKEACTPLTKLFVQYYMLNRFEESREEDIDSRVKRVKLFIIDKPINFYSLAVVMNKGNPFRRSFDKFIKKFVEAGLMYTLTVEFQDKFERLKYFIRNADQGQEKLSVYHVQGPFAIWGIGNGIAILVFFMENLWFFKLCKTFQSEKSKASYIGRDPRDKNLYYDCKYGNMYGRNYPKELS